MASIWADLGTSDHTKTSLKARASLIDLSAHIAFPTMLYTDITLSDNTSW